MKVFATFMAVAFVLGPAASFADKPQEPKKGRGQVEQGAVTFTLDQRKAVQAYFVEEHGRGGCPPGLAKKGNGCLPPGQAKRRYSVGKALPKGVAWEPLPAQLSIRIGAPPKGYMYVMLDGDLVKLAVGTALVVDAIEGLVN